MTKEMKPQLQPMLQGLQPHHSCAQQQCSWLHTQGPLQGPALGLEVLQGPGWIKAWLCAAAAPPQELLLSPSVSEGTVHSAAGTEAQHRVTQPAACRVCPLEYIIINNGRCTQLQDCGEAGNQQPSMKPTNLNGHTSLKSTQGGCPGGLRGVRVLLCHVWPKKWRWVASKRDRRSCSLAGDCCKRGRGVGMQLLTCTWGHGEMPLIGQAVTAWGIEHS